jgi:hypothetical protein
VADEWFAATKVAMAGDSSECAYFMFCMVITALLSLAKW